ncbi:two-component system, OmpR family, sensor histidine kinase KdpD [Saccharopolyspora antimicrobica]|uniref:histidine kinase n=1 Tax=Saccharopolyspora antimicrobica TaxID=455193 RepID=A0A1I4T5J8_9PSEU|nr:sensor histidine kinase KdpD [Saccharopolyspora antimicrobica]RKT85856.1 two-component system sensor histidine kinase KdpD [Saccharopolyspora antimicrobica]SFM71921.1 two-component system, OmpR family, sensor histidine kinase KdpD [Saccharopolyspora antimicrobica]
MAENGRRRGELRIYLGAAPGVGKTYAMLNEAHRRVERGTDVVVGFVEDHGRAKTAALLDGLEVVPRAQIEHRGVALTEMDLAAVLARKPEVAVVDELAHTNVPGSRHEKRWQDVEELLEAGINVLSTVNVQHLESLNDVVEAITGIRQQETVPDEVVRRAEQIELADITPQALRRRMAHGNVYAADRVDAALGNYFRTGNLTALRELALLWLADQVDVALRRYRAEQKITDTWEARERVVVAVTGGPESETLIRRARRIAARAGAELQVVHVLRSDGLAGASPSGVARARKLADAVGASFHTVVGDDVPEALLEFARAADATQLVVGTSRRSRWARLFDEGIGALTVQKSGAIDVHMVTHPEAGGRQLLRKIARNPLSAARKSWAWVLSVLLPGAVTAVAYAAGFDALSTDVVGYFLATVIVALVGGMAPAIVAALLSGGLLNFFLTPPLYTLTVAEPQNLVTVIAMMIVGMVVAFTVDRAARLADRASSARTEAALLTSYARTVLTHPDPLARLLEKVVENFGLTSAALLERTDDGWQVAAATGSERCTRPEDSDVDIEVNQDVHLVLRRPGRRPLPAADRTVLEGAAGQALMALRQQRMAAEAQEAQRRADATQLRTALLSAVGHDLRTPLASIKASVSSLRAPDLQLSAADTAELLAGVEESADRLTDLVGNLLDSSRLATGAIAPRLRPVGYYEVAARALAGLDGQQHVDVEIDESLPPVLADVGLLERVVANVVQNALKYGRPGGGRIGVRASEHAARVELRVVDHGPGLPEGAADTVFAPFERLGDLGDTGPAGVGLGLSVAQGFMTAMEGTIRAEDTPGGGLTIVLSLPAADGQGRR